MAKTKDGPIKIPKRIAGVKIPKAIRKGPVGDFLGSKAGQAVIAEMIMAAGALLAKQQSEPGSKTRRAAADLKDTVAEAAPATSVGLGGASASLAFAVAEAGRAFKDALAGRTEAAAPVDAPDADWPVDFEVAEPEDEKKRARRGAAEARPH